MFAEYLQTSSWDYEDESDYFLSDIELATEVEMSSEDECEFSEPEQEPHEMEEDESFYADMPPLEDDYYFVLPVYFNPSNYVIQVPDFGEIFIAER